MSVVCGCVLLKMKAHLKNVHFDGNNEWCIQFNLSGTIVRKEKSLLTEDCRTKPSKQSYCCLGVRAHGHELAQSRLLYS